MKTPKLKKYDAVEILWQDSNIPQQPGWQTEREYADWCKGAGSMVLSRGTYISQDDDFINLIGDMDADGEERNYLRPINIGKGFIKSIRRLK